MFLIVRIVWKSGAHSPGKASQNKNTFDAVIVDNCSKWKNGDRA